MVLQFETGVTGGWGEKPGMFLLFSQPMAARPGDIRQSVCSPPESTSPLLSWVRKAPGPVPFQIFQTESSSILSPVSGFLADAGFTHSLTPARNCTFGCTYCYVPTMRVRAGLRSGDWQHWGQWTTIKRNAAQLLRRELRSHQVIYCSPLTDPYQPAEAEAHLMPDLLEAVAGNPPRAFVIQTRGPLITRDIDLLRVLAARTTLRVSFSITTDSDKSPASFRTRLRTDLRALGNRCGVAIGGNRNVCRDRSDIALRSRGPYRTGGRAHAGADRCRPFPRTRREALGRYNAGRGDRNLCSPRLERVAGSGVSTLDPRSAGGAGKRKGQKIWSRACRIRIACASP